MEKENKYKGKPRIVNTLLSKEQILLVIQYVELFQQLDEEDRCEYSWVYDIMCMDSLSIAKKIECYAMFHNALISWYRYLNRYIRIEDYDMCAKIRDAIKLEVKSFKWAIKYYTFFWSEEENENIDQIASAIKNSALKLENA